MSYIPNDNQLTLKSVNQLFQKGNEFFIPAYQRGYRWTDRQIKQLLVDIWEFSRKERKKDGEFYCLQPIVVKQENNRFIVIDGQQRLTTLFLIIKYFEDTINSNPKFQGISFSPLDYETRQDSRYFLTYVKTKTKDDAKDDIDFFHIRRAYKTIIKWFGDKKKDVEIDKFLDTLLSVQIENRDEGIIDTANNVRVIWYKTSESENDDPIDIFTRLNIGKISLTNSELVKALFLQRGNFDKEVTLKQLKIALEWDIIEKRLQDDSFWFFIYNKKNPLKYDNRIEYILDLMKGKTEEMDDYYTFNKFYNDDFAHKNNKPDIDKIWLEIKQYFMTFEWWFNDSELFHYIGYLVYFTNDVSLIKDEAAKITKTKFKE